jgi:hypothetical protein
MVLKASWYAMLSQPALKVWQNLSATLRVHLALAVDERAIIPVDILMGVRDWRP